MQEHCLAECAGSLGVWCIFCNLAIIFVMVTIQITTEPATIVYFSRKSDIYSRSLSHDLAR